MSTNNNKKLLNPIKQKGAVKTKEAVKNNKGAEQKITDGNKLLRNALQVNMRAKEQNIIKDNKKTTLKIINQAQQTNKKTLTQLDPEILNVSNKKLFLRNNFKQTLMNIYINAAKDVITRREWSNLLDKIIEISKGILDYNNNINDTEFIKSENPNDKDCVNIANNFNQELNTIIKKFMKEYVVDKNETAIQNFIINIGNFITVNLFSVTNVSKANQEFFANKNTPKVYSFEMADLIIQDIINSTVSQMCVELNDQGIKDQLQRKFIDKIKLVQLFLQDIKSDNFDRSEQSNQSKNIMKKVFDEEYFNNNFPKIKTEYINTLEYLRPDDKSFYNTSCEFLKKLIGGLASYTKYKYTQKTKEEKEEVINEELPGILLHKQKQKKDKLQPLPNDNFAEKCQQKILDFTKYINSRLVSQYTKGAFLKFIECFDNIYKSLTSEFSNDYLVSININLLIDTFVTQLIQINYSDVKNKNISQEQIDIHKKELNDSAKTLLKNFKTKDEQTKCKQFYDFLDKMIPILKTCVDSYDKVMTNIKNSNIKSNNQNGNNKIENDNKSENSQNEEKKEKENIKIDENSELDENINESSIENNIQNGKKEDIKLDTSSIKESKNEKSENNSYKEEMNALIKQMNKSDKEENIENSENEQNNKSIKEAYKQEENEKEEIVINDNELNFENKNNGNKNNENTNSKNENEKPIKDSSIQSANNQHKGSDNKNKQNHRAKSANNQHKGSDNKNKQNHRAKSAKNNKKHNIDDILKQYNNVRNVENVGGNANEQRNNNNIEHINQHRNINNQQENENDKAYYTNIIRDFVNNATPLPAETDLRQFRAFYRNNKNILQHKSAFFWLNEQERRNNVLLDFIINDNANQSLETLNTRLEHISGGKCSWCCGDW